MARRYRDGDLQVMHTTPALRIGEGHPAYGPHEADSDVFPGALALEDLRRASTEDAPRILARYAALRSWLLREAAADPILVRHALDTARAYLAATDPWPEAAPLRRLAEADAEPDAAWEAATAADHAGHTEGAYALLRAGYMAARRNAEIPWAARFAAAITELLERHGMDGAELWAGRATRLRGLADDP
jgi:hypothetical protein